MNLEQIVKCSQKLSLSNWEEFNLVQDVYNVRYVFLNENVKDVFNKIKKLLDDYKKRETHLTSERIKEYASEMEMAR